MADALERCGARFTIAQAPRSRWPLRVALVGVVLALFVFLKYLWLLPIVAWIVIIVRLASVPKTPVTVTVTPGALSAGPNEIAFADVEEVRVVDGGIVVKTTGGQVRLDLGWLSTDELRAIAKHLEARVLLAHGPPREPDEQVALEAFHALDARAVRVREHVVVEVLSEDGPWNVEGDERVYVRRLP